ncbi:transmembrane protein 25 [Eublepharis macularius]|uniref:Transmembrane protein 25 n=1 Tax=Eublepharis macularius TaxID=481883 RepID=A0AA97LFX7_EUBMA|nr:transmembrane protein 25 [Eublepharis macularius]
MIFPAYSRLQFKSSLGKRCRPATQQAAAFPGHNPALWREGRLLPSAWHLLSGPQALSPLPLPRTARNRKPGGGALDGQWQIFRAGGGESRRGGQGSRDPEPCGELCPSPPAPSSPGRSKGGQSPGRAAQRQSQARLPAEARPGQAPRRRGAAGRLGPRRESTGQEGSGAGPARPSFNETGGRTGPDGTGQARRAGRSRLGRFQLGTARRGRTARVRLPWAGPGQGARRPLPRIGCRARARARSTPGFGAAVLAAAATPPGRPDPSPPPWSSPGQGGLRRAAFRLLAGRRRPTKGAGRDGASSAAPPGSGCRREAREGCRGPHRPGLGCAGRMAPPLLLLLLLHLQVLLWPGAAEPGGGRLLWPSSAPGPESRAVSCLTAAPSLAWYLDGERQETHDGDGATASRDRRLNCSAVDPTTGQASGASVLLRVHFKAEAVQLEARAEDGTGPGLVLVLLVSVQARPPADITWVDQDGRLLVNASHFLIVDAQTYPWLGNASVEVQLRSLGRNLSRGASTLLPGFLGSRIELPLLALVVGAAVTLGILIGLGMLLSCLVYQKGKKAAGLAVPAQLPPSDSNHLKLQRAQMPRANMSLPSNLKLNDRPEEPQGTAMAEEEEEALSEPENSLVLEDRGLSQFPMVGYIYRASSVSSEEIWL